MAAELLLKAIATKEIEAVICRAPEFTDRKTKGLTNALIFDSLRKGKAQIFLKTVSCEHLYLPLMPVKLWH
jgi:hypothetical protein